MIRPPGPIKALVGNGCDLLTRGHMTRGDLEVHVSEAHHPVAPIERGAEPALGAIRGADLVEHVEHAARRAAV